MSRLRAVDTPREGGPHDLHRRQGDAVSVLDGHRVEGERELLLGHVLSLSSAVMCAAG
jgi:hypothetical protein